MEPTRFEIWLRRVAVLVTTVAVVGGIIGTWWGAAAINADLLVPVASDPEFDLEVISVEAGRIVLPRTDLTEQEGIWGVMGSSGYGQITSLVAVREATVEHGFRTMEGEFFPGEEVRLDRYAFNEDPAVAAGLAFEEVRIPGELGVNPAWLVPNVRDTWIVLVHGKGLDERRQALRILPTLANLGFPVLVISYRNDGVAPDADPARYGWGLSEWLDVQAALDFGLQRGAEDYVLYGYGMGGSIISMFLHESDSAGLVRGVVLDSPGLVIGRLAEEAVRSHGIPGIFAGLAKAIVRIWSGIEWDDLDQLTRASELDVPVLLMHGSEDAVIPIEASDTLAEQRPDLVTYERFEGAGHDALWNVDPTRYMEAVAGFLTTVVPEEGQ